MARSKNPAAAAAYQVIDRFVDVAFRREDSLFTPGRAIWTAENLDDLHRRFVEQPDESDATFIQKFRRQLEGAPEATIQLAAEAVYVQTLAPTDMGKRKKAELVESVLRLTPTPIAFSDELKSGLDGRLAGDMSFLIHRPFHVTYLIEVGRRWRELDRETRTRLLSDPWAFKEFCYSVKVKASQPMREILLFFVFPESFESISSRKHKQMIVDALSSQLTDPPADRDRALLALRERLSPRYGESFSWYAKEVRSLWQKEPATTTDRLGAFLRWLSKIVAGEEFEKWEIVYKHEIAKRLAVARAAVRAGDANWMEPLKTSLNKNELLDWRVSEKFLKWCERSPAEARKAFAALWADGIVNERAKAFEEVLPREAASGPGGRASLLAFLLMAEGADDNPMYRYEIVKKGCELADYKLQPSSLDAVSSYFFAVEFFDFLRREAAERGMEIRSRLEAQSGVWGVVKGGTKPSNWSDDEWNDLLKFRSGSAIDGGGTEGDEEEDGGEEDAIEDLASVADRLLLPVEFCDRLRRLLTEKRQAILYGPPGTGKTYVGKELAKAFAGSPDRVRLVQFHPSYAYEDFVEGYRPFLQDGQAGYRLEDGPLKEMAAAAAADPQRKYVLVIDEINRGNLAKVFGELYFLLEYRGEAVRLQYSKQDFRLPENLWVVGTMNTADRSIALLDAALRRRFYFVPFFPDRAPVEGLLERWLKRHAPDRLWVADVVRKANDEIKDRHFAIGPSHFMKEGLTDEWIEMIWSHAVLPYVEEHFFGDADRVASFDLALLRSGSRNGHSAETSKDSSEPRDAATDSA